MSTVSPTRDSVKIPGRNLYPNTTSFVASSPSQTLSLEPYVSPDKPGRSAQHTIVSDIPLASALLPSSDGFYLGMSGSVLSLPGRVPKGAFNASPNILIGYSLYHSALSVLPPAACEPDPNTSAQLSKGLRPS